MIAYTVIALLIAILLYLIVYILTVPKVKEETQLLFPRERPRRRRRNRLPPQTPETRGPPYRTWAPAKFQQVGILTSTGKETLPLYGRRTPAYNSRYNYYTVTNGNQLYPLVISIDGRDCTEDIGCNELYGNEDVTIIDRPDIYKPKMYRINPQYYNGGGF